MKENENIIIWLDYFNKTLTRNKGRRVNKENCIYDPTIKELTNAAISAGLKIIHNNENARYPRRPYVRSGYIAIPKNNTKKKVINEISMKIIKYRLKNKSI